MSGRRVSETPSVSVVIPTFNRAEIVERCVKAVLSDPAAREIIVVDDGSKDDTLITLHPLLLADSRMRLLSQAENIGRSRARQKGIEEATSDIVVLLDDDVIADPGLISGHQRAQMFKRSLVVGYMPVALKRRSSVFTRIYSSEYEGAVRAYRNPKVVTRKLWGGNISLPRDIAAQATAAIVDQADSYHEDRTFGRECAKLGLVGRFEKSLTAQHLHSRDLEGFLNDAYKRGQALGGKLKPWQWLAASNDTAWLARQLLSPITKTRGKPASTAAKALRKISTYQGIRDANKDLVS